MVGIVGALGTAANIAGSLGTITQSISSMFGGGGKSAGENFRRQFKFTHRQAVKDQALKYTREVDSLRRAGLNPALAYGFGAGQGSHLANVQTGYAPDYEVNRMASAREAAVASATINKLKADADASESVAQLNRATAVRTGVQTQIDTSNAQVAASDAALRTYLDSMGRQFVEHEKMTADQAEAYLRQTYARSDYAARMHLDRWATTLGYFNYPSMLREEEGRQIIQQSAIQAYSMPKASAEHDFYLTPWGKEVAPFVNSVGGAASIIDTLGNVGAKRAFKYGDKYFDKRGNFKRR